MTCHKTFLVKHHLDENKLATENAETKKDE